MKRNAPIDSEFVEPTRASRRKILVALGSGLVVGLATLQFLVPWGMSTLQALPLCEQMHWLNGIFIGVFGAAILMAAWIFFIAHRILRLGQWPLPNAEVWRRTPILRGAAVRWRAYAALAASLALVVVTVRAGFPMNGHVAKHEAKACGAPGPATK